jgi:RNA polymerase sigma-70 factor (ECF subfamily)
VESSDVEGWRHDPQSFEAVFEQFHSSIWRFLARLGGREHADDLAGEVFVVALARRETFDPSRGSVRAWLYGIAANLSRTRLRGERRRARAFARAAAERGDTAPADAVIDDLAQRARLQQVLAALATLAAPDREVIALYAWEQLSYEEIAEVLRVEIGTVRSRLARARRRLRAAVDLTEPATSNGPRRIAGGDHDYG